MTDETGKNEQANSEEELDLDIELGGGSIDADVSTPVKIVVDGTVRKQMIEYAATDKSNELGGMLIGTFKPGDQPTVYVEAWIQARYTDRSVASLTFTHETWQDVLEIKDRVYPEKTIVGWFHTHPGHNVFLSSYDMHIHTNFFDIEWQIAYVVDPVNHTEGFFRWENGAVKKTLDYKVIGEVAPVEGEPSEEIKPAQVPFYLDWKSYAILLLVIFILLLSRSNQNLSRLTYQISDSNDALTQSVVQLESVIINLQSQISNLETQQPTEPRDYDEVISRIEEFVSDAPYPTAPHPDSWLVHTVQRGETLGSISELYYGSSEYWTVIAGANYRTYPRLVIDTRLLQEGAELLIPGIQSESGYNVQVLDGIPEHAGPDSPQDVENHESGNEEADVLSEGENTG